MNYHNITKDDMLNGDGLRVVLWTAGCSHHCKECQNPITWDPNGGIPFDEAAYQEIKEYLENDYAEGLTLSGGDPLFAGNIKEIEALTKRVKADFPKKTIWIYSGYVWEDILTSDNEDMKIRENILRNCDVFIDSPFQIEKKNVALKWKGSSNQRVIDLKRSFAAYDESGDTAPILHCGD